MEQQHVKSFNRDSRSKNRFRFSSSKQRSKKVSADVYRSYKRRYGVTSAGDREESVHRPKRQRKEGEDEEEEEYASTFAEELELASERNGSHLFAEFYRETWPLVRSVPELLHHADTVIDILLAYIVSPESFPNEKSTFDMGEDESRVSFIVNHATTDILHLLAVMAKDLQQEIHPFVYKKIMPRLVMDILNPPPPPSESGKQAIPVDVLIVETTFRTLSYIFQHDAEHLVSESIRQGEEPCLEPMRKFYGPTLGHKREVVRRLAAETFAPLVRRIKSDGARKKHLKRVVRALTKSDASSKSSTHSLQRAKADAIDGVSTLLFETAKGVAGRLHSKGSLIVRFVFDYISAIGKDLNESTANFALSFLEKLYRHICSGPDKKFDEVCTELQRLMLRILEKNLDTTGNGAFVCSVNILLQAFNFKNNLFFDVANEEGSEDGAQYRLHAFVDILGDLTEPTRFGNLSLPASTAVLKLFFAIWNVAAGLSEYTVGFHSKLARVLQVCGLKKHTDSTSFRLAVVVQTYLDCCIEPEAVRLAFPSIISAIASLAPVDGEQARELLFRVVSRIPLETDGNHDEDSLFAMNSDKSEFQCGSEQCMVLLNLCTSVKVRPEGTKVVMDLACVGYSLRCVPFLCSVLDGEDDHLGEKQALQWMFENVKILVKCITNDDQIDQVVAAALSLEGFARVATVIHRQHQHSWLRKLINRCKPYAWTLLKKSPGSLWVTKSVAALCGVLQVLDMALCDDSSAAFDLLLSNLRQESHFLRLHTLEVLNTLPSRPFVVNHGDLDLTDDLDEEPAFYGQVKGEQSGLSGKCDIIHTLLKIERSSVGVGTERGITSLITRVEVLGKSGKLPIVYAEAVANHMIGILHVKFSSLWVPASRALCGLTQSHHNILCDATCNMLNDLLKPELLPEKLEAASHLDSIAHHQSCCEWEVSRGRFASLFQSKITSSEEQGQVSSFLSTDRETVLQEVLKVIERVPEITAKSSRRIVPMFIDFLKLQYYRYHDNEPDARELKMVASTEDKSGWTKAMMNRRTLESRLLSFLRAFAAVKGTQQLYQRSTLLSIFNVNLSHQDGAVAHAALTCIINFQLPYVTPYAERLKHLLKKGGLRDALLDFPFSSDKEIIHSDHREYLLPIVQRILFGRLSASSMRGTGSKDSPLARRKAIVSALAQLEEGELFPLFYLMIRNYTPRTFELTWENVVDKKYKAAVLRTTSSSRELHFRSIPIQRHEGFMNLLSALIVQLGHRLCNYVPTFMSILVGVMKGTAVAGVIDEEAEREMNDLEPDLEAANVVTASKSLRMRGVRSLSFRCTASLMDQFAGAIDFTPCSNALWDGMSMSVNDLPSMVAKGNSTPSILVLLVVLSSHSAFQPILLDKPVIVECVILCIGPSTDAKALDAVLDFILNLLSAEQSGRGDGRNLIGSRILLILRRFRSRFGGLLGEAQATKSMQNISKELMVLRKIGDMLLDSSNMVDAGDGDESQTELFNTLTSLLVRFASHPRCHEADHVNALGIVSTLLPKVDAEAALSHFYCLSKLLSHDYWSKLSASVRRQVTETMWALSKCEGVDPAMERIVGLLQDIFAVNQKRLEEMDYDRVLPALAGLADNDDERQWVSLLNLEAKGNPDDVLPKLLTPVVYACFALLHQEDLVVSRSAFNALRALVRISPLQDDSLWPKFIETTVVPGARAALRGSSEQIRRHGISLLAEICCRYKDSDSPNLHGDLHVLACEENSDLDFFVNILNVQSHRRSRALQRLRSRLNGDAGEGGYDRVVSVHSLANVILPLVTTPVYESKTNLEETLAQESVATVGAVGRHLTWSKYHSVLWTALNQLNRHPEQEKLIIGMICALLDSFHFELNEAHEGEDCCESSVWRALEKRVIPKIEDLLVKEKRHRIKGVTKSLRPNVVLALLKLLKKFPPDYFNAKLPRLLAIVCDALKNRDSNVRELARKALAEMTLELGTMQLSAIIQSLAVTLKEGYQLYVRNATLHHILLKLSSEYSPPVATPINEIPDFDRCIPAMMDLIMQDMFGVASERKDDKRLVKEAMGSKHSDSLEIISRLLLFRPMNTNNLNFPQGLSSLHAVVMPLFEKVRQDYVDSKSISKIKDSLRRVVVGLSHNDSVLTDEMLQFIYATISPILEWTGAHRYAKAKSESSEGHGVVVWQPKQMASAQDGKGAVLNKKSDQAKVVKVKDGVQAPKLTGTARHAQASQGNNLNSPASTCAVEFGLNLLLATMKSTKTREGTDDLQSRLTPFLSLMTTCVCVSREDSVTLLAIRNVGTLLKKGVQPNPEVVGPLGTKIIDMLATGEATIGANPQLTQVCIVALSALMKLDIPQADSSAAKQGNEGKFLSLTDDQISILISLLKESIATTDETNASLGMIKVLLSRKYMSPELYDLMERLLDLSVRSHRESFREQCSSVFLQFLLDYPLSKERFEQHVRQVMLNMKYEHKEGRMSAIGLVASLIERLPFELVDDHSQLIFLPLVLQLVNDEAAECRAKASMCLTRLVARASPKIVASLHEYNVRWYRGDNPTLKRASLQMFGIFAEGKSTMFGQGDVAEMVTQCIQDSLEASDCDWEEHYLSLVSLEKMLQLNLVKLQYNPVLWSGVRGELSHAHLWVRMAASRIVGSELDRLDPAALGTSLSLVAERGCLYDLATNFTGHLDAEESNMSTELSELAIKSLTWLARAMERNPQLCYTSGEGEGKQPVKWLFTRLSNIAKRKGTLRRQAVFKCFAALLHACGTEVVTPYLLLMMEPLHRAIIEAAGTRDHLGYAKYSTESDLAKEVLGMLEESCGDEFLTNLATVKVQARERHDKRKDQLKAEMVADPMAAAKKKIIKQTKEKHRRKRRVEEHRHDRGGKAKRQYYSDTELLSASTGAGTAKKSIQTW